MTNYFDERLLLLKFSETAVLDLVLSCFKSEFDFHACALLLTHLVADLNCNSDCKRTLGVYLNGALTCCDNGSCIMRLTKAKHTLPWCLGS